MLKLKDGFFGPLVLGGEKTARNISENAANGGGQKGKSAGLTARFQAGGENDKLSFHRNLYGTSRV